MSAKLRLEQCCTAEGCVRPARELGGYCTRCWQGLSPECRAFLIWEADLTTDAEPEVTESIDTQAIALCVELEAILDVPWDEGRRAA